MSLIVQVLLPQVIQAGLPFPQQQTFLQVTHLLWLAFVKQTTYMYGFGMLRGMFRVRTAIQLLYHTDIVIQPDQAVQSPSITHQIILRALPPSMLRLPQQTA